MQLTILVLNVLFSVVLSLKPPDLPQCESLPASLSSGESQQVINNIQVNINGPVNFIYPSHQQFQESTTELTNQFLQWGGYIVIIFLAFGVSYLNRAARNAETPPAPNDRSARCQPGRSGAVSRGESRSEDQSSSPDGTDTSPTPPAKRGKQLASGALTDESLQPSLASLWGQGQQSSAIEKRKGRSLDDDPHSEPPSASVSLPRSLSAPVQAAIPLPSSDNQPIPRATSPVPLSNHSTKRTSSVSVIEATDADASDSSPPGFVYEHELPLATEPTRLQRILYGFGPCIFWYILVIAVDIDQAVDAQPDLKFLQEMFQQPPGSAYIHFEGLSGRHATLRKIKKKIRLLYRVARDFSVNARFFILFTGLGDEKNRMRLLNREVMTAKALKRWLSCLQAESPRTQPVTIAFDICRQTHGKASTKMYHEVSLIWSCSPGQGAHALRFPSRDDIPSSVFLISLLFVSCGDVPTNHTFEAGFGQQMDRLVTFLRYARRVVHTMDCNNCRGQSTCDQAEDPELSLQTPDWQQASDTFPELARFLSRHYSEFARNVRHVFMSNNWYRQANNIPSTTNPEPNFAPQPADRTGQHIRGANEPVHELQAMG